MKVTGEHDDLDAATIKQLVWKPSIVRNLAIGIVEKILRYPCTLWPDEIAHADLPTDDRCTVGIAYRLLISADVIRQTGNYRKSHAGERRSGIVFQYELKSRARAETFLKRNGRTAIESNQRELFGTN